MRGVLLFASLALCQGKRSSRVGRIIQEREEASYFNLVTVAITQILENLIEWQGDMELGDSKPCKKHALLLTVNLQAHLVGMYRLGLQLSKRGVTVTFVCQEKDVATVKSFDELRGLDFNLVAYGPEYPANFLTAAHDLGEVEMAKAFLSIETIFQPIRNKLVSDQKAGVPGPTCIIAERFLPWVKKVAKDLSIPYYPFFSNGAMSVRQWQGIREMLAAGKYLLDDSGTKLRRFEGLVQISGLPAIRYDELPPFTRKIPSMNLAVLSTLEGGEGLIINTFYELEAPLIEAMQQTFVKQSRGRVQKLFLIGPLASTFKDRSFVSELDAHRNECLSWLDTQPPHSVLYICLGSVATWTADEINELAVALEASEQRFLWVLRLGADISSLSESHPPDFEARLRSKGLIVTGWVPQLQILAHQSVGGFLTHCGWNSVIESISFGVPMIGWPLFAEQFLNCRFVVDVLQIAGEVEQVKEDGLHVATHVEFEKAIRYLMVEEGAAMRSRIQSLMLKAKAATADGGCSQRAVMELVDDIPGR